MSNADNVRSQYKAESTYGVLPSGNFQQLLVNSDSLKFDPQYIESERIIDDRQVADLIRVDASVSGALDVEVSYGMWDEFWESALYSGGWAPTEASITASLSFVNSDNSLNRATGDFTTNFSAGQWLVITGAATNGATIYAKAGTVTATKIILLQFDVVGDEGPLSLTVKGFASIKNGTSQKSLAYQRSYQDLTNEHAQFLGLIPRSFSVDFNIGSIVTGRFELLGKSETSVTSVNGTTAALTTPVKNTVDDIVSILEGGTTFAGGTVLGFTLSVDNNLRPRSGLALLGPKSIGAGKCRVTGTLRVYYETKTLYDKFLANTPTYLVLVTKDSSNNRYVWELPRLKLQTGERIPSGVNTDIVASFSFTAYKDVVSDLNQIKIARLSSAV